MPLFRIDDQFHGHPKVLAAGNAAVGLWVRCGSYSSAFLLDGYVPADIAHMYGTRKEIEAATSSTLWTPVIGGFMLPDFLQYNYSSEKVRADRAKDTERQRSWREQHARNGASRDTSRRDTDPPKPIPKPSVLTTAAAAADASTRPSPAAAAALNLYIDHKVRTDAPRNEAGYRRRLGQVLPIEHAEQLEQLLTTEPDADRDAIARVVYGMTTTDIRRAERART